MTKDGLLFGDGAQKARGISNTAIGADYENAVTSLTLVYLTVLPMMPAVVATAMLRTAAAQVMTWMMLLLSLKTDQNVLVTQ